MPQTREKTAPVWHQYVIRTEKRDELQTYLDQHNIGSIIHYPIPPHLQEAYRYLEVERGSLPITERFADEVLSIPMYSGMTPEEQAIVIEVLNKYQGGK